MERTDIVVVGAGPVGLALALGLSRAGRSVVTLEKDPGTAEHSRAPAIWPRTQEILADLGIIDAFLERGITRRRLAVTDVDADRRLITLPLEELAGETDWPQLLITPQSETERLLALAVERQPTATLLFSAEVSDVENTPSGVSVVYRQGADAASEETVEASFAVGCDGAHSRMREAIGAELVGKTYGVRAALADIAFQDGDHLPFPRISTRDGPAIGIRIDSNLWRLILPFAESEQIQLDDRVERAVRNLFPTVLGVDGAYEKVWQSEFRLHRRMSTRFLAGRVALAGDAAHLNSPVGGQGMNAGIQDAEALIPALLQALDQDSPEPLESYARRRKQAVEQGVNRFTDGLTRLLLIGGGRLIKPMMRGADWALRFRAIRRRILRRIAMLESGSGGRPDQRP